MYKKVISPPHHLNISQLLLEIPFISCNFASMNETYSNMELNDKRIAVLLSGGVDSSVVVYELAQRGLHPDCFYIKIGPEEQEEWDCTSEEDLEMATAVARRFGCKLEVVDCHREYWDQVTRYRSLCADRD